MSRSERTEGSVRPIESPACAGANCRATDARQFGFTLIETMVAIAVFAIAALALLRLDGATVAATVRLQDRQLGQIVARNVALAAYTDPLSPALGDSDGAEENGGRAWTWTRRVDRIGDGALLRIDVRVTDADGVPAGALTMLRSAR